MKDGEIKNEIKSLPVWEEWIEIRCCASCTRSGWMSLPVWEEWIEIKRLSGFCKAELQSLPVWEEWIEILRLVAKLVAN